MLTSRGGPVGGVPLEQSPCSMCGRLRDPSVRCPHCGNTPEVLAAELDRINKAIASMSTEDLSLVAQRKKLSQQLQAAMHQRNLISHAVAEQERRTAPQQRGRLFGGARRGAANKMAAGNLGNVGTAKTGLPRQGTALKPPSNG